MSKSTPFKVVGKLLGFIVSEGKIKYLRLEVENQELEIKLGKETIKSFDTILQLNDIVEVQGEKKVKTLCSPPTFKAHFIEIKNKQTQVVNNFTCPNKKPLKLMLCHKSGCVKKGGRKQKESLVQIIQEMGLQDQIIIEETGCLGQCSHAPNIMLMPGKKRLSGLKPEAIAQLTRQLLVNRQGNNSLSE